MLSPLFKNEHINGDRQIFNYWLVKNLNLIEDVENEIFNHLYIIKKKRTIKLPKMEDFKKYYYTNDDGIVFVRTGYALTHYYSNYFCQVDFNNQKITSFSFFFENDKDNRYFIDFKNSFIKKLTVDHDLNPSQPYTYFHLDTNQQNIHAFF